MYEQSKAARRRWYDGAFHSRYFVGKGLDIGAGPDGLSKMIGLFPRIESVREWDLPDGDAQYLAGVADGTFDFVHSSHCLEHMVDCRVALAHWLRVLKPGGHLVVTIPEEDLYERGVWPSRFNPDHKWTFTANKRESWSPKSVNVVDLASELGEVGELERLLVLRDFFRPEIVGDQTMLPNTECAIELVLRRRPAPIPELIRHAAGTLSLIPPVGRARLQSTRRGLMLIESGSDETARLLEGFGEAREEELALFGQILRPGDVVVDAPAGIGAASVGLARMVGPQGLVHAFEADPGRFRLLHANAALNEVPQLVVHGAGEASLDALDLSRLRILRVADPLQVLPVVQGARATIARCRPILHLAGHEPSVTEPLLTLLSELGYRGFWHQAPLLRDQNFYARPVGGVFRGRIVVSVLGAPEGFDIRDGTPCRSADWQADAAFARAEAARAEAVRAESSGAEAGHGA